MKCKTKPKIIKKNKALKQGKQGFKSKMWMNVLTNSGHYLTIICPGQRINLIVMYKCRKK